MLHIHPICDAPSSIMSSPPSTDPNVSMMGLDCLLDSALNRIELNRNAESKSGRLDENDGS